MEAGMMVLSPKGTKSMKCRIDKALEECNVNSDEWSAAEKRMMCMIVEESPQLDFPLIFEKNAAGGEECVYDICGLSNAMKLVLFDKHYPFRMVEVARNEGIYDSYLDLHSGETYSRAQFGLIRYKGRNMLVSPDYLATGGMAVDMIFGE